MNLTGHTYGKVFLLAIRDDSYINKETMDLTEES